MDPPLLRGPLVDHPPSTPTVATRGPSTPWGTRMDQLLQERSTGGSSTTKGRSAGGPALPVGCPMGGSSTPEVVFWWTSHSRGGSLVDTPLQRWCTGGPSTLRDDIWGWRPSLWFYVCAYAYDIYIYICIHIHERTYMGTCIDTHAYICIHTYAHIYVCVYVCICVYDHIYKSVYIHIYMYLQSI